MQNILSADFYLFGFILLGVVVCSYSFLVAEKPIPDPIKFWLASIGFAIGQYLISGFAIQSSPVGFQAGLNAFLVSNLFSVFSGTFQTLFCYAILQPISKGGIKPVILGLIFFSTQLTLVNYFENTLLVAFEIGVLIPILLMLQIIFLFKYQRIDKSPQINLLLIFTAIQLILAGFKLLAISYRFFANDQTPEVIGFNEIPIVLIAIATTNMFFNVLAYLAMAGFWSSRAVKAKELISNENSRIHQLLAERDGLINSLSRANKTAVTGALSATLAHELNQPLGAIKLNIELLKNLLEESNPPLVAKRVMQDIENQNQRATDLIKTLRSIFIESKVESKKIVLDDLIQSIGNLYKSKFNELDIDVEYSLSASNPIDINSLELHQAIVNLINNAIDALESSASSTKRKIIIETSQSNRITEISISDTGPGVPIVQEAQMFELIKPSAKPEGMGLGLWLVNFIVERHHGSIKYQRSKFGGAQFIITLPKG
jgi:signal transduction histidine kinase